MGVEERGIVLARVLVRDALVLGNAIEEAVAEEEEEEAAAAVVVVVEEIVRDGGQEIENALDDFKRLPF